MAKPVILFNNGELTGLSGNADGEVLTWNDSTQEWESAAVAGTGTVTSVTLSTASTGLTVSGGTSQSITSSGTFTLGGTLGAGYGGTGLGAPVAGDVGKVLTAKADGTYELATPAPAGVTSITAGTGLSGGTITSTGTISMPNVGTARTDYGSASQTVTLSTDDQGRVTALTQNNILITQTQVTGLTDDLAGKVPTTRSVNTTAGQLTGGGDLSSNLTLGLASVLTAGDYGTASSVPVFHADAYGRVTSVTPTSIAIATSQVDGLDAALSGKALKTTTISSGTGISVTGGGTLADNNTISLASGVVTAATKGSASKSATITVDTYGRVTSLSDQDIAIDASQVTSGQLSLTQGGTGINASGAAAGELLIGASGGGALALHTVSGDATLASSGAMTVTRLQGNAVSSAAPGNGQVLQWNGTTWIAGEIPQGGSGGGGVVWFLNSATSATAPTTNLPYTGGSGGTLADFNPAQTSPTFDGTAQTRTTGTLPTDGSWKIVQGFVSDAAINVTTIPAGIWDFNIWAQASTGAGPSQTEFRIRVGKYSSTNVLTYLFDSLTTYIADPTVPAQYVCSVIIGANTLATTDRLYVELNARATTSGRTATFYFGDSQPTHVHTTLPSVTGTGIVHVVNGVFQSPATAVDLASSDVTGTLSVANGGTGAASLDAHEVLIGNGTSAITSVSLGAGQVLVGTTSDNPAAATIGSGTGVTVSSSSGAISIAIGQSVDTSASPTFAGLTLSGLTNGLVKSTSGVLSGGNTVSLTSDVTGTLPVGNGGTGLTSLTSGNLYLGNGASAPTALAGSLAGDYVKWNGSTWASAALSSDAVTALSGTSGQITASGSVGSVTLSLPNVGTARTGYGSAAKTVTLSTDAQGRVTSLVEQAISISVTDVSGAAPLNSPTFTGTPSLPTGTTGVTQSAGNNTTALATTAFVQTAVSGAGSTPYDVSGFLPINPSPDTNSWFFTAVRTFTLAQTGHTGGMTSVPTSAVSCNVYQVADGKPASIASATLLGTLTFNTDGSVSSSFSSSTQFTTGKVLMLKTPASVFSIVGPYFTFAATVG